MKAILKARCMIFYGLSVSGLPGVSSLFSMGRFTEHKEMPIKEAMLVSLENTGIGRHAGGQ